MKFANIPKPPELYFKYFYSDRRGRAIFVCNVFNKYIRSCRSFLDIGGGEGYIGECLQSTNIQFYYVNLDIAGKPTIKYDLELGRLPFRDNSFDMVICTDVLEHIDNLHSLFKDIIRVCKKYILISLPNMFHLGFRLRILFGKDNIKFYGLPPKKPSDRHKWFFSYNQARHFIHEMAKKFYLEIVEEFPYFDRSRLLRTEIFWPIKIRFVNLFAMTYWCLLAKKTYTIP